MLITKLQIKNFRGIEELTLSLDDLCVLIGENNTGKSTILDALRACLTRSLARRGTVFEEYDYHLANAGSEPSKSKPIEITITFAELNEDEWPEEITQLLEKAEQVGDNDIRSVTLCVKSGYDAVIGDFSTSYDFLDLQGNALVQAKNPRTLINLQQLVPTFYLASLRDAAQEFRPRSQFWGPFVRALNLDEDTRAELEGALSELNNKILEQHTAFASVKERLKKTAELLPLGDDPVSIEAVPSKVFDILSRTQVSFASKTGARIPIMRHGNGTQSLAVIFLFDAFLESRLAEGYGENAEPLLALEEPEAHLHPSAIKAVGEMLQKLSGQKIITTHSGDLLASLPLHKIRRLRRKDGKISCHQLTDGVLTNDDIKKLDYKVRATRGSLLFARCWLLIEGETEALLLPECARTLGYDLLADGVSCVEFSQIGVDKLIKLADQLGIEWFVVTDNDHEGKKYEKSAEDQLNGRSKNSHIRLLDHGRMEVFLCMEGFGHIYENNVAPQKASDVKASRGSLLYWEQVAKAQPKNAKPKNAIAVAENMSAQGETCIPSQLKEIIEQARLLARSCG